MDVTIVGADAIGSITGAHLARAGHRVLFHIIREIEEGRRRMDWANLTEIDRAGR